MPDMHNLDIVNFEKNLPENLIRAEYKSISIWSIARIYIANWLAVRVENKEVIAGENYEAAYWATKLHKIIDEISCIITFLLELFQNRDAKIIIRVNSFSILGESDEGILFKNRNLQAIYNYCMESEFKCLVIINDLPGWKLQQKIASAILFPPRLASLMGRIFRICNKSDIDSIVIEFSKALSLKMQHLQVLITNQLALFYIWNFIYKFIEPEIVYYECPHNGLEPEVVASKKNNIKTIEIYHGGITPYEPSYYQRHLNYGGLVHSVCDEFLSPSKGQTKFLRGINNKYKKITTVRYKPTFVLSIRQKFKFTRMRNRSENGKGKFLFITSITDGDIYDIKKYIGENRRYLLKNFSTISLRLHPDDSKTRWKSLMGTYRFVKLSNLSLVEDIVSSNALAVISPTVILQLKANKINFVNLSRNMI